MKKFMSFVLVSTSLFISFPTFLLANNDNFIILQSKQDGSVNGNYYLGTNVDTIRWGVLPDKDAPSVLTIPSGSTVTIDTLSHEGILEDQGRNPINYFTSKGLDENMILQDSIAIANSNIPHDFDKDGPHIVTGPIYIQEANPGDVLKVEVLSLTPRVPYGIISNRHYKGVLVDEFPEDSIRQEGASLSEPEKYGNVSIYTPIKKSGEQYIGYMLQDGKEVTFPIHPFLGLMGVAENSSTSPSSVPPTRLGGNIDINELGVGSTVYLPVDVPGALFFTGDPHFAQGDGEVALTALEGSLRAELRFTVLKKGSSEIPGDTNNFDMVFGETEDYWIPVGLNEDLDEALKQAVRESINFLSEQLGVDRKMAYAYLSAATDYEVSQAVDKTKGIHALLSKRDFSNFITVKLNINSTTLETTIKPDGFYIPAAKVFTALNATYRYSPSDKSLITNYNGRTFTFHLGSNKYIDNNETKTLAKSPYIENGIFYIPTTALLDIMQIPLNWSTDGATIYGTLGY